MPIDSKECFAALTEDGQLWEIYQAAQTGGGGGTPSGPAGGDLAGTYPNPTVDGLQGNPVSNAVPVNGQVLQFDGTSWVPGAIPSGGSGGGGVVYFLNFNTAADAPVTNIPQTPNTTKELGIIAEAVTTSYTSPILSTASYDFLASFVTDLNVPAATAIPAGLWDFNIWAESTTTNTSNHILYKIEVLKYDGANAPVLLATSADNYIYDPQDITQYVTSIVLPQTTILATDRIVVYLYGKATQNNNTITFHFGGQYPSHTHSTMPSVTGTGVVKVINGVFQSPASTIVDTDVSATANIAQSKIANLTTDLSAKVGGSVGAVDNSVLRADVGTGIVQNSGIIIDDVATATQDNVAIRNNSAAANSAIVLTPKGTGALILGPKPDGTATGGNARGAYAVDFQISKSASTQVASGNNSLIIGGQNNTSNGSESICIGGQSTISSQTRSCAINSNFSTASGADAIVIGDRCEAIAAYTQSLGAFARSDRYGMQSFASGSYGTAASFRGNAQRARFVLRCKTTTNAAVEMALDGATTYLGIPSGKVIACTINISGVKSDGSAVAHYVRQYAVKNVGGTSSEVYAPVTIGTDNAAGTVIALSANNADDTLRIAVTGIAAETWRWVASVDAVEIAYGT